ncbi:MAG TPA: exodeoxyribonuclease V subunit gamma [Chromatiaceae bacterium]|jgi:exodeoxyribonuclease V gamma subunit|nr:MAG: hypothetical protein N838_09005 [Thiohalocapsa sp. PB-PSB1]QQO54632.1 MAG: exodeoxyribonuclease V subunit gamma [Thiohalocapsa sp. PB-PSB1]HBG93735.1 exodeoxyribonuclease V subunit gamma [Chromatiaceae bacterium]HCS90670.1 exodeoxyribonuclease V subunit gamma [Chromatiaceae bacterium]
MLQVHHSNRLEVLLLLLRQILSEPLRDAFDSEQIVVQNQGMARWLAQQLAAADGIAANLAFPLPASFIWRVFRAWIGDLPEQSDYDRDRLAWRIYARLPVHLQDPAFAELSGYLQGEPRALKRWQLAWRISDLFDRYLVYRPELVLNWETGAGTDWQASLWRDLCSNRPGPHRARLFADVQSAFAAGRSPVAPELLPERVALFGLTALAPAQCTVLRVLAQACDVHLFLLNPCIEYWADVVDERGHMRRRARALAEGLPDPGSLLDLGNPLLAAFGHSGQAFVDQVLELDDDPTDVFIETNEQTLLACLQQDILTLTDRRSADPAERRLLDPADTSLSVHCCHGPLREVQVLHDQLLGLFETMVVSRSTPDASQASGLEPRDIFVMAPDIDLYAPFIEAVFGSAPSARHIPWAIADRRLGAEQPLLAALSELLALPLSRVTAPQLLGWLQVPAVARRFQIDPAGLARIRTWVQESGVRWGLDADMRAGLALPADDANSWAFGLRRLFLGYALPPDSAVYADTLPYADIEGSDAVLLGALQEFIDQISHWREILARPHHAEAWRRHISAMLDALFAPDEDEEALLQRMREALDDFAEQAAAAGLGPNAAQAAADTLPDQRIESLLAPDILRAHLQEVIDQPAAGHRFLTGAVTFCNMVPMRNIPAPVICLLGMNAGDFPRAQRPLGFDLMAKHPRRGDRSRRDDDRYLFLEVLLSARDRLHISYIGRDARDNGIKVPSVVVDELLDVIDRGFILPGTTKPEQRLPSTRIRIEHPLQPFSPRCFDALDTRLHSYAEDWLEVAQSADGGHIKTFARLAARETAASEPPLPALAELPPVIQLSDLIRFLRDPARWFLEQRLRLRLPWDAANLTDSEPFGVAGLERWSIAQQLLALGDQAQNAEGLARLRAEGVLPHGAAGELLYWREARRVERFRNQRDRLASNPLPPIELDLVLADTGIRIQGSLDGITDAGLIDCRLGRLKAKHLLDLWSRHLALNAVAVADMPRQSCYLSEAKDNLVLTRLSPVADALAQLGELTALFIAAHAGPLPLFPESSLAWAQYRDMTKVLNVWEDAYPERAGEGSEMAIRTALRGQANPLGEPFQNLSRQVFDPLLAAMETQDPW